MPFESYDILLIESDEIIKNFQAQTILTVPAIVL